MPLTRDFKITVVERLKREPELAKAMYDEAVELLQSGEPDVSREILRTLVNATVGFDELARKTSGDKHSLHRMLSARGNPGMKNLSAILRVLRAEVHAQLY